MSKSPEQESSPFGEARKKFNTRRAAALSSIVLAVSGVGYALASKFSAASASEGQAIPLIKAGGFQRPDIRDESWDGKTLYIFGMLAGQCYLYDVQAHLSYRDGKVVEVSDYQYTYDYTDPSVPPGYSNQAEQTITFQSLADLRKQKAPDLNC